MITIFSVSFYLRFVNTILYKLTLKHLFYFWYTKDMKSLHLSRPHAIMMVGLPGSGKSFFAGQFAETFNAPYIDALTLTSYAKDVKSAMKIITNFAGQIARTGQTFIYEGDTDSRAMRTEFAQFARRNGYQPLIVWVQVDEKTAKDRTLKAGKMNEDTFESIIKTFSPPHPSEKPIVISGKHTYASQAKVILARLSKEVRARPSTAPPRPTDTPARRTVTVRTWANHLQILNSAK